MCVPFQVRATTKVESTAKREASRTENILWSWVLLAETVAAFPYSLFCAKLSCLRVDQPRVGRCDKRQPCMGAASCATLNCNLSQLAHSPTRQILADSELNVGSTSRRVGFE